jgi:glycosyltransferase involved in cell wall biosynthesis
VVLNTQGCYAEFAKVYGRRRATKFHVVSNGIDPDLRANVELITHGHRHANANGVFRICHPGSVYGRRTIAPVLEAIARLNQSGYRIQFSQIGRMDDLTKARTMTDRALTENLVCHGMMPHREALEVMAASDAFAVIQPDAPTQVPGKLYEMMLFKRPILALTNSGDTAEIVRRYKLGPVVSPDDVAAIQKAIEAIMSSSRAETMSRWCVAQRDFDGLRLTKSLSHVLQKAKR